MNTKSSSANSKSRGGRSVSYPALTLPAAIERARQFWEKEKKHAAPVASAIECWGYGSKSSGGKLAVAALINFGLLENSGAKNGRHVKITDRALTIIHDPDPLNKAKAVKEAAVAPKIYSELLAKWGVDSLPSDSTISYYLLKEKNFNSNSVSTFIKNFKETIAFANLTSSDSLSSSEKIEEDEINSENGSMFGESLNNQQITSNMKQDTFSLDEGQAILKWPTNMKAESFEDFKSWLELQLRKISRTILQKE